MLEYVIKRNGSIEKADASKINRWMQDLSKDIIDRLDWSSVVMEVVRESPEKMTSQDLQMALAKKFVAKQSWVSSLMAGRLYGIWHWKNLFGDNLPTIKEHHKQMQALGLMEDLGFSDEIYSEVDKIVNHDQDLDLVEFQIKQIIYKYGLCNRILKKQQETPQFVYMRMAMALAKFEAPENQLATIKEYYSSFSKNKINAPTPNFTNLGTPHRGYASCCLITASDSAPSLAAADHAAYVMTYMSAGIGRFLNCRSIGDSVRGGAIEHQGKMPYFESAAGAVKANLQGGRGGADTEYVTVFDPEIETIVMAQNPRTPLKKQNRKIHFAISYNAFFTKKAAKRENIFTFNCFTAPDLQAAFFSPDLEKFEELYEKYEADPTFKKNYLDAWKLATKIEQQGHEVSTLYTFDVQRANVQTAFKEPVYQSNLCGEIVNVTKPYPSAEWLYKTDHHEGEIGICNIGGIVVSKIVDDADYEEQAYLALKMIDNTINMSHYELPHIGYTCKARRNAAIGMVGIAEVFARKGIRFDSPYGLKIAHQMAERHLYFLVKGSLRLAKERGVAEWMHKTKWVDGWMPFDNYKKALDKIVLNTLRYDWGTLRAEVIANGGIRNSTLVAHMPTESSSKAAGVPNGPYPVRELFMKKSDLNALLDWVAPDDDLIGENYQIAYEIDTVDLIKYYGVLQKFCDQSISADFYMDRVKKPTLTDNELVMHLVERTRYGVITKYYQNSLTTEPDDLDKASEDQEDQVTFQPNERAECVGACTL